MRKLILALFGAFLIVTPFDASGMVVKKISSVKPLKKKVVKTTPYKVKNTEREVIRLVNIERKKRNLKPLELNLKVSKVAREKSKDMKVKKYFSHQSPTYGSPSDMLKEFKISYEAAGENIAAGGKTAKGVMKLWMKSPGHRYNILNPSYTHMGAGSIKGDPWRSYWTQVFIKK